MSLDGYIAGPSGEYDWIVMDPDMDFPALMRRFDTFLIGRKTFEAMQRLGTAAPPTPGITSIVCSRTLRPGDCAPATLSDDAARSIIDLRTKPGKDIALFGRWRAVPQSAGGWSRRRSERVRGARAARRRHSAAAVTRRSREAEAADAPNLSKDGNGGTRVRHRVDHRTLTLRGAPMLAA
jgi:hypothetical protein